MGYDVRCKDIAEVFLVDCGAHKREDYKVLVDELAQKVQDAIEDYLDVKGFAP